MRITDYCHPPAQAIGYSIKIEKAAKKMTAAFKRICLITRITGLAIAKYKP